MQSEGRVLKEATYINKSLSFLEQAIIALGDQKRDHIPFRQCKLTHALKDSLGTGRRGRVDARGGGTGPAQLLLLLLVTELLPFTVIPDTA